ncbi:MAG: RNA polymerase sigma factor [Clostridia bacterium]|jgi:RNA polymerase sigma-70 factor (ECF subfamily)|nr:RNA polymerase sigma factor [Clostridia bacterium]
MDELLLRRARQGDADAFEQLMTPLEKLIWRVCWHYTGQRETASDCAQEAMIKIWRSLDSYRGDCAFESWVYRIAANCSMDAMRKKKRDRSESIEPLKEAGFDPADPEPGTEEKVIAAERKRQLRECITRLPEDQRDALVMTQLEGMSYEDAARRLDVSEGTIKSRVNRAKAKLKEWLTDSGELSAPGSVQKSERRDLS